MRQTVTLKVLVETKRKIKILAALKGMSILDVLEEIVSRELERVQGKQEKDDSTQLQIPHLSN